MGSTIQHELICIDEGLGTLLHINERDESENWQVPIGQPQARDMQLVGGNRVLISHHHGCQLKVWRHPSFQKLLLNLLRWTAKLN